MRSPTASAMRNCRGMKTLEEFDFAQAPQIPAAKIRELAEGGYIERSEPVVLIGECGTGKSHLATGLCLAACRQKRRVRFHHRGGAGQRVGGSQTEQPGAAVDGAVAEVRADRAR